MLNTYLKNHVLTEVEKAILKPYFENQDPSNIETEAVLDSLLKLSSDYWTKQKVRNAWRYMQRKKTQLNK
ncbi:2487_t:CDS:2 [Funneliformis caledonium]|uniref:2487_t:CDS:1 n=1 Tax=Funneliformis caledonium TaxID=1117310 RepID=A0A9N9EKL9_9GLOM|nr:2487_t:CDS:2 [Funneliformis caledonium]